MFASQNYNRPAFAITTIFLTLLGTCQPYCRPRSCCSAAGVSASCSASVPHSLFVPRCLGGWCLAREPPGPVRHRSPVTITACLAYQPPAPAGHTKHALVVNCISSSLFVNHQVLWGTEIMDSHCVGGGGGVSGYLHMNNQILLVTPNTHRHEPHF